MELATARTCIRIAAVSAFFMTSASLCSAGERVEYIHTDALGSVVAVTNQAGEVISRASYEPYGATQDRSDGPAYAGHVSDLETGLSYMQQRYYDPDAGRFLSVDPVGPGRSSGALFNRYYYAGNNPYRYYDPDGRCTGSRITNVDNTCASTGEFTTQAKSATSVGVRSVSSVFTHSSVSSPDASVSPSSSAMPKQTTAAARRFLGSTVGGAVGREAVRTQQKINLIQTLPASGFMPSFSGGFDASQGGNFVSYSLDVAGYKQSLGNPAELRGVGLDTLFSHEIGHTPLGAAALGYGHLPFDSSDAGEINAVRYFENPYRREIGLPARETYSGIPIP
jgi:RHS repeat-associated protein